MSLKIEGNKFYVLKIADEMWIYKTEDSAVEALKTNLVEKDVEPEEISILEVSIKEGQWEIIQVPWSRIAYKLIKR